MRLPISAVSFASRPVHHNRRACLCHGTFRRQRVDQRSSVVAERHQRDHCSDRRLRHRPLRTVTRQQLRHEPLAHVDLRLAVVLVVPLVLDNVEMEVV